MGRIGEAICNFMLWKPFPMTRVGKITINKHCKEVFVGVRVKMMIVSEPRGQEGYASFYILLFSAHYMLHKI